MGVRPDHRPDLPDELAFLGDRLEAAASGELDRRRRRRRSLLKGACAVVVGIPFALAVASTDVAPSAQPVSEIARTGTYVTEPMLNASFRLDRVPDESGAAGGRPCVMVPDCRSDAPILP